MRMINTESRKWGVIASVGAVGLLLCGLLFFLLSKPTPEELAAEFLQRGGAIDLSGDRSTSVTAKVHLIGENFGGRDLHTLHKTLADSVEELWFLATGISSDALSHAQSFPHLKRLSFAVRRIDHAFVEFIARHHELETLDLRGCEFVASDVLGPLADLESLRELDLYGADVRGGVLEPLEGLRLSNLSLRHARLDTKAVASVGRMAHLADLDVAYAGLGAADLLAISHLKSIKRLVLSGHAIPADLLLGLGGAEDLQMLNLNGCFLDGDTLEAVEELRSLQEIAISGGMGVSGDQLAEHVMNLPSIDTIRVESDSSAIGTLRRNGWTEQSEGVFVRETSQEQRMAPPELGYPSQGSPTGTPDSE